METLTICHVCGAPYPIADGHNCPKLRSPACRKAKRPAPVCPKHPGRARSPKETPLTQTLAESPPRTAVWPFSRPRAGNPELIRQAARIFAAEGFSSACIRGRSRQDDGLFLGIADELDRLTAAALVPVQAKDGWQSHRRCSNCAPCPGAGCRCSCHVTGPAGLAAAETAAPR